MGGAHLGLPDSSCPPRARGRPMVWRGGRPGCCWKMFSLSFSASMTCGASVCSSRSGFSCLTFITSPAPARGKQERGGRKVTAAPLGGMERRSEREGVWEGREGLKREHEKRQKGKILKRTEENRGKRRKKSKEGRKDNKGRLRYRKE